MYRQWQIKQSVGVKALSIYIQLNVLICVVFGGLADGVMQGYLIYLAFKTKLNICCLKSYMYE